MNEIVISPHVYKKLVGMQMLIEGLAMGAFATIFRETHDPLLRRTTQLVMSDGSSTLRLLDPVSFRERGRLSVRDGSASVRNLNDRLPAAIAHIRPAAPAPRMITSKFFIAAI
jgi:hypothetical protein